MNGALSSVSYTHSFPPYIHIPYPDWLLSCPFIILRILCSKTDDFKDYIRFKVFPS